MEPKPHLLLKLTQAREDRPLTTSAMGVREWYEERWRDETLDGQIYDSFYCSRATPEMMDACWADGWRHFGTYFFRTQVDILNGKPAIVLPLRVRVADFRLSKSQRRIWRKNQDVDVVIRPIEISGEHIKMFHAHKQRFTHNVPRDLSDFFSPQPAITPCLGYECRIIEKETERLLAASFVDIGADALSSVYAMFDPKESQRSLGILTLLCEIEYAQRLGKEFLYLGYAYNVSSFYDYKKYFSALEYYNWRGEWLPIAKAPAPLTDLSAEGENEQPPTHNSEQNSAQNSAQNFGQPTDE
jgi:arginine-tRNA-protein transferase